MRLGVLAALAAALAAVGLWARSASASPVGPGRFRKAVLEEALRALGEKESGGMNRGREVDEYLKNVGQPPGQAWCAAAAWTWIKRASDRLGGQTVIAMLPPTAGARQLMQEFQTAGWFVSAESVRDNPLLFPPPGSLAFWDRSNPPGSSWQAHVGVVRGTLSGGSWTSIEANSGPTSTEVAEMVEALANPRLLGFGVFPD